MSSTTAAGRKRGLAALTPEKEGEELGSTADSSFTAKTAGSSNASAAAGTSSKRQKKLSKVDEEEEVDGEENGVQEAEDEDGEDDRAGSSSSSSSAAAGAGAGGAGAGGKKRGGSAGGAGSSNLIPAGRYAVAADAAVVLRKVKQLAESMKAKNGGDGSIKGSFSSLAALGIVDGSGADEGAGGGSAGGAGGFVEVEELTPDEVMASIEAVLGDVTTSILNGEGFAYSVPSRTAANQRYIKELDRIVLMKDKTSLRPFTSVASVRKATIMTRALQLIFDVLSKGIHVTKRDLFYTDVKLFQDQKDSDAVLDDLASMVGCTRTSLHVVASDKGIVVGRVKFRDDGDLIDCTKMGIGGKAIPPFIDRITDISSDAQFILLVEKEAAFMRIAEDRFYNRYPCIVITAKGQPDVATRLFLRKLKTTLNIPVLGLVDSDPYGLKILSVYMSGSKAMSYDSASLTTPDIKWLGVRPSDLDKYRIPDQCRLDMTAQDIKTGQELLQEDFIKANPKWVEELEWMCKNKVKAEIQSLSSFDFQYLTHTYLPEKLKNGDWI